MARLKSLVRNNNSVLYREKFKRNWIEIPPGKEIEMSRRDAVAFKGQLPPLDEEGERPPKMITVIHRDEGEMIHKCNMCSKEFDTSLLLNTHLTEHSSKTVKLEEVEERLGKQIQDIVKQNAPEKLYFCHVCDHEEADKDKLKQHLKTHIDTPGKKK